MSGAEHPDWARAGADWPNREASRFIEAGSARWHVQIAGAAGPTILLLHGSGAATHSWRDLLPRLARSHRVVAPDLPGHGFTRVANPRTLSLPGMTEAVGDLVTALGMPPDIIVGHSAGAAVAIQTALSGRTAPRLIVGLNAALTPFRGIAGVLFPPLAKVLALNPVTPWLFSTLAGGEGQARRLIEGTGSKIDARGLALYGRLLGRPGHVGNALSMMALWDLDPLLAGLDRLRTPVHLIVAMNDRSVPPDEAIRLARHHPMITLEQVEGYGHLMHEEDPTLAEQLILRAIAAERPAG